MSAPSRRALVTGANRGIGLAIAQGLAERGLMVWVGARDRDAGERAAARIGARALLLDVADPDSIRSALREAGDIDVLVNNAGVLGTGGVLDDPIDFNASMRTMVEGPWWLMHQLVPGMQQRGYGRVVNVSSGWGAFCDGASGPGAYGIAKAALNALTVAAARSQPPKVKINAMCPGWVRTRMGGAGADRSPEQGADTALWLATLPSDGPSGEFFRDRVPIAW